VGAERLDTPRARVAVRRHLLQSITPGFRGSQGFGKAGKGGRLEGCEKSNIRGGKAGKDLGRCCRTVKSRSRARRLSKGGQRQTPEVGGKVLLEPMEEIVLELEGAGAAMIG